MIVAVPSYHPSTAPADRAIRLVMDAIDALPLPDRLLALRSLAALLGTRRAGTVLAARGQGMSWAEIADRLGMSRLAVWLRYGPEEGQSSRPSARTLALTVRPPRHYSSCASYKAVTSRPAEELPA